MDSAIAPYCTATKRMDLSTVLYFLILSLCKNGALLSNSTHSCPEFLVAAGASSNSAPQGLFAHGPMHGDFSESNVA